MKKNRNFLAENLKYIPNPTKKICNNLIGKEHNLTHRVIVGTIIMTVGVYITKLAAMTHNIFIDILGDTIGFLLHGIGAIPFVEVFIKLNKKRNESKYKEK